ncbi:DNA polymerase III subunit chi [Colwellia sp. 4_MG-2023]|uniref:DNA polymerase III subunit chi n=1 Tax=unclassified Colwellia TaxID=196834 RepID=UPI001C098DAC|nr:MULTISPECIES: DNA polymerase III subunit chi [unclassified Colwellia]MBU2925568.1 DNA polymerase III subunit chi [Colwellia sp. C2M11]MDO6489185.1 DNA polymerase III subunit chi [Colwellia sp. 6_MG-2023]MDO6508400.1 DNA polymerase III subunit chi [Colwellia sp. 5_MG-2023]MDO6557016.1 DNA polymerase III subunit chi [Colwellia sp. 4_MG-2023]MDO6651463.1 DNA polymerase III subunit chi [Colwellia sp. 3_MG-2023]
MQTQVMFYLLNDEKTDNNDKDAETTDKSSALYHACLQASHFYRQNQRVFIYTQDKEQAEQIDELLWAFDTDSFVPHNLAGEGPKQGAMVEISDQPLRGRRPVLINLTETMPTFANQFQFIVDFVPSDEILKQKARERFKTCRQWGFQVNNQVVAQPQ